MAANANICSKIVSRHGRHKPQRSGRRPVVHSRSAKSTPVLFRPEIYILPVLSDIVDPGSDDEERSLLWNEMRAIGICASASNALLLGFSLPAIPHCSVVARVNMLIPLLLTLFIKTMRHLDRHAVPETAEIRLGTSVTERNVCQLQWHFLEEYAHFLP